MNPYHTLIAVMEIPSGLVPDISTRLYIPKQWETNSRKFSGVRSSGQYCRPENIRLVNSAIPGREMNGHISLLRMGD
jgi:hypothetical protein